MPEPHGNDCPIADALRGHLDELHEREKQLAGMVTQQKSARKTSVAASLEARLRVVSLEIYDLENILKGASNTAPYIP